MVLRVGILSTARIGVQHVIPALHRAELTAIDVDGWLQQGDADARLIMQVHDELVLEVRQDQLEAVREQIIELMCGAAELRVPLRVDAGSGANWDEAH